MREGARPGEPDEGQHRSGITVRARGGDATNGLLCLRGGAVSTADTHVEHHYLHRAGWLRAAVLGANDGLVSTASLLMGVSASSAGDSETLMVAGLAALVAGAMSMAAGEFVSVSSQADVERVDEAIERAALEAHPEAELDELSGIYEARGVEPALAKEVARQLMAHDALDAHLRDELGLTDTTAARPLQAAAMSGVAFGTGAALPLAVAGLAPASVAPGAIAGSAVVGMILLGVVSGRAGGKVEPKSVLRLVGWGVAAMAITWLVGAAV
ncbi:MAG: VIT family protein [Alphaproteobacteria bacterium]|nr:VIT family protein [Alphaproteobacteria bacterium]